MNIPVKEYNFYEKMLKLQSKELNFSRDRLIYELENKLEKLSTEKFWRFNIANGEVNISCFQSSGKFNYPLRKIKRKKYYCAIRLPDRCFENLGLKVIRGDKTSFQRLLHARKPKIEFFIYDTILKLIPHIEEYIDSKKIIDENQALISIMTEQIKYARLFLNANLISNFLTGDKIDIDDMILKERINHIKDEKTDLQCLLGDVYRVYELPFDVRTLIYNENFDDKKFQIALITDHMSGINSIFRLEVGLNTSSYNVKTCFYINESFLLSLFKKIISELDN